MASSLPLTPLDPAEIARRFPAPVAKARALREVFGDGVRLIYAKDRATGDVLERPYKAPKA